MRLHRFFIAEPIGNKKELEVHDRELVNQLRHVFRLKTGDEVVIFDGSGSDYVCHISGFDEKFVKFQILSARRSAYLPLRKIFLCAAIVKKDNFELIVEKATELGVTDIIPVLAERTEKKALNESRLKKIAIEASEQSGRGSVPVIHSIMKLAEIIEFFNKKVDVDVNVEKENIEIVAFHLDGVRFSSETISKTAPVAILIGPEGGWSPAEIDMFHKANIQMVCLGPQVLRAETAVIAAISQFVFLETQIPCR